MSRRAAFGAWAEDLAARTLAAAGCEIIERNFRVRLGEIDLVAREGSILAFVEVKARRGTGYGTPGDAVAARKRRRIRRAAVHYLAQRRPQAPRIRFDVVSIVLPPGGGPPRIEWIRGAFDEAE